MEEPRTLKVLSLNCWGLWIVANRRRERIQAIAEWISAPATARYDVIALQELWVQDDFKLLSEHAKRVGYDHSRFFYSGAIGSGLAFLSRHAIESSFIRPYSLNGSPLHFIEGDFFAGKSIAGISITLDNHDNDDDDDARVDDGNLGMNGTRRRGRRRRAKRTVDVLNTHMYAPGGEGDSVDGAPRIAQAWELSNVVRDKLAAGRHVIVTGDFNSQPHSIITNLLVRRTGLTDSFAETHDAPPSITSTRHGALAPFDLVQTHGITCDSPVNSYSAAKLKHKAPTDEVIVRGGKRLDYILYRSPSHDDDDDVDDDGDGERLVATSNRVVLTEPIPTIATPTSYSDHFGLETTFALTKTTARQSRSSGGGGGGSHSPLARDSEAEVLLKSLSALSRRYRATTSTSRRQLQLFALSLALVASIAVASSFEPVKWLNWILTLAATANAFFGTTMLYVGFVAAKWERGALRNVIGEIEHELDRIRKTRRS